MEKSKLFSLNLKDVGRSILIVIFTSLITGLYQIIETNGELSWLTIKPVVVMSLGAGISYLIKNLITNSNDALLKKELKK